MVPLRPVAFSLLAEQFKRSSYHRHWGMIDAGENPKLPLEGYVERRRFVGRRRKKPQTSRESGRSLRHRRSFAFPISDIAIAEQHDELARECLAQHDPIDWTIGEPVRKLLCLRGEGVATGTRCNCTAKAGFRHEEHETMHELTAAGEPNDVVVIVCQTEIVPHGAEQPFDGGECPFRFRKDSPRGIEHVAERIRVLWVVLLGELWRKHNGIQHLKLGSRDIAGLTSGLWFAAVHDEHDAGFGREGWRTAEPHGDRMMRTRIREHKAAGRLTRDVRGDAGLTRCDPATADDDEREHQKSPYSEAGHVLDPTCNYSVGGSS